MGVKAVKSVETFDKMLKAGDSLSEPALWIEWRNQGSLFATAGSQLLSLCSNDLKDAVLSSSKTMLEASVVIYAWTFARVVSDRMQCNVGITDIDSIFVPRPRG